MMKCLDISVSLIINHMQSKTISIPNAKRLFIGVFIVYLSIYLFQEGYAFGQWLQSNQP